MSYIYAENSIDEYIINTIESGSNYLLENAATEYINAAISVMTESNNEIDSFVDSIIDNLDNDDIDEVIDSGLNIDIEDYDDEEHYYSEEDDDIDVILDMDIDPLEIYDELDDEI